MGWVFLPAQGHCLLNTSVIICQTSIGISQEIDLAKGKTKQFGLVKTIKHFLYIITFMQLGVVVTSSCILGRITPSLLGNFTASMIAEIKQLV